MMRKLLNKISWNADEHWQQAMLEVWSDCWRQILQKARLGHTRIVVRPNLKVIGQSYELFDKVQVAVVMTKLLQAEGLDAKVYERDLVRVGWDSTPKHWVEDN